MPNGEPFDLLTMRIAKAETETRTLPAKLSTREPYRLQDAINRNNPRQVALSMRNMNWTLNGKTFEMEAVTAEETVTLGNLEVWEFINPMNAGGMMGQGSQHGWYDAAGGGMMDFMAHPMHLHGVQFKVAGREVARQAMAGWQTVRDGLLDEGWKDTVLVMPVSG